MERFYSKIIGMPVFVPNSLRPIHTVDGIVIDPVNGNVLAFIVDHRKALVITVKDVVSMKHGLLIRDEDDVVEAEDILRVQAILDKYGEFVGKKVVTEGGKRLGKVSDLAIDDTGFVLGKIFVVKSFLGIVQFDARVFAMKSIVEVKATEIVVKNDEGDVKILDEETEERVAYGRAS